MMSPKGVYKRSEKELARLRKQSKQPDKYTDDELLSILVEWNKTKKASPTKRIFDSTKSLPSSSIYTIRFGSWNTALTMARLKLNKQSTGYKHTGNAKKRISNAMNGKKYRLGTKTSKETRKKIANSIVRHHKYLKENSGDIIVLTRRVHRSLHARAYDYIYDTYGKDGIDKYIEWFSKKHGGIYDTN